MTIRGTNKRKGKLAGKKRGEKTNVRKGQKNGRTAVKEHVKVEDREERIREITIGRQNKEAEKQQGERGKR